MFLDLLVTQTLVSQPIYLVVIIVARIMEGLGREFEEMLHLRG